MGLIDGIKGADRITCNDQASRPVLYAFKVAQAILWCAIATNGRQRLSYTQRLIDTWVRQITRPLQKAFLVGWWKMTSKAS